MRAAAFGAAVLLAGGLTPVATEAVDRQFTCDHITGILLSPPDWGAEHDGFADTSVTLISRPNKGEGTVSWSNGNTYQGVTAEVSAGFIIITVGADWTELYQVNVSSLDLMMTATRGGSSVLPNAAKAFHGVCRPGTQ
jgi:hypothetical protein